MYIYIYIYSNEHKEIRTILIKSINVKYIFIFNLHRTFYQKNKDIKVNYIIPKYKAL